MDDESFNNVVEGTRQYFMGLPKPSQDGSVQHTWSAGSSVDEGAPAHSGVPTVSSRPPSAAAAPPSTSTPIPINVPSRPPSEPIEPEPHIIHKATVMREAAEKRREQPEIEDEEEVNGALSPPSHIIRKPTPHMMPSPALASAVSSPSPVRPPSAAPPLLQSAPEQLELSAQYRTSVHRVHTPTIRPADHYNSSRTDPYSVSRQPEGFLRYQYDPNSAESGRLSHGSSTASPQPSIQHRHSPQTYARISSAMPQHVNRLNEASIHTAAVHQRYPLSASQPPPPHNDRVPPIHHPLVVPAAKILTAGDIRSSQMYKNRESSSYSRALSNYERHQPITQRKYDAQQTYSGYRPSTSHLAANHIGEIRSQSQYKHGAIDAVNSHYTTRPPDRAVLPQQPHVHEHSRVIPRTDYINKSHLNSKTYNYPIPSTSTVRYVQSSAMSVHQNNPSVPPRSNYRSTVAQKASYEYPINQIQTSPSRPAVKPGYQNPQTKMTVSVTSIVDQMNQTKQRRESPLDLSVKTVKNSADSSTTQDEVIDSASMKNENMTLQPRSNSNSRSNVTSYSAYVASHKVDFAPDFAQYRGERTNASQGYNMSPQPSHPTVRHNEIFDPPRPVVDPCPIESRPTHPDRPKYQNYNRNEYVPRIDLTRSSGDEPYLDNRIRDDRHFMIEDRKRVGGPDISNIPKKNVRYETWSADSRIERINESAREQRELMSRPVYNYTSYKRFEAYQNDQKRSLVPNAYRDTQPHVSHRYSSNMGPEQSHRDLNVYQGSYRDKNSSGTSSRHIIQKIPNHRDIPPHLTTETHSALQQPADKKVLSILRNSLEIKQNFNEPTKSAIQIPDLIVIDDVDDPIIDITDLTKEVESERRPNQNPRNIANAAMQTLGHDIQMPKAIDSITRDDLRFDQTELKTKSPENDVASRIRTKAELKVMPPSQDNSAKSDKINSNQTDEVKTVPKSQKQHLFNQIREDNLRLESVIKTEKPVEIISDIKTEPMCIDDIEKDAVRPVKTESNYEITENHSKDVNSGEPEADIDWATACDSFMEQLKEGCHKKKPQRKCHGIGTPDIENKIIETNPISLDDSVEKAQITSDIIVNIKQEPKDSEEEKLEKENVPTPVQDIPLKTKSVNKEKSKGDKKTDKENDKVNKNRISSKTKNKNDKGNRLSSVISVKKQTVEELPIVKIKEEAESTDDDEPLIKSKLLKEKEQSDRLKYQLLKELAEKSAYVKLECCDDMNTRKSLDFNIKEKEFVKIIKHKSVRQLSKSKEKPTTAHDIKNETVNDIISDSDDDTLSVASRLRVRKNTKSDETSIISTNKTPVKSSHSKIIDSISSSSTPLRKSGFGDGSDFHPGWEEELYRYKRSLRMPTRLIAIPRGRSGGPFFLKSCANQLMRGSTSLPDLDPVPLSPAPSSAQSAATDDIYRRPDKHTLDSDLESNSSCSAVNTRLHYDSEASTSTIFSSTKTSNKKRTSNSIVDVLIQKCGRKEDGKKKNKEKDDKYMKVIAKSSNTTELLPTPSLGLVKSGNKGNLSAKKEKLMEDIFYLGAFRKETVTMFRTAFINNTNGLIGATEEFAPVVLKSRTRTESRVLKQRATIKEVFGDDRPASAPPSSYREDYSPDADEESPTSIKKEVDVKQKLKPKPKSKILRRSSSIRDGLRSTKSLKRNDAKGRMMRLKKRNSILKSLITSKKNKESTNVKSKPVKTDPPLNDKDISVPGTAGTNTKKRFKRLFGRRKFSSGFDYIRKKKKIIRRDNSPKVRRQAPKPSPESVHDIQKEIKGWFINKSIGETHLHRAARLGFTDCVAYCLEKMKADPSAKDNAGFTALHVASAKGHVRIAKLLLQYGANVSAAAQGGIRPLHEASENSHVEVIRLLLAYGADPVLGTYAGQTPEELAEGPAAKLLRSHIADVQGQAVEPWIYPSPAEILDREAMGCDPLSSPPPASPPPPPDSMIEIQCSDFPLPPFYSLRTAPGQPTDGLWCLLQDITNVLQIKSKESLLKQIHCGSGSPKELLREIRTQEFLERAQCHQLLCAGEKVNVRASKVALIRVTDKLRQLLKIETVLVS